MEWQKIAIESAMMKNSGIVVFDEPTASLDPVAEVNIFELLSKISEDKISIVVSHRLRITKYCNRILAMESGKIDEIWTYEQLMKNGGLYKNLYTKQAQWYE